ncbi:hypothetical protein [Citrobacter freundii]|uniref:hypothetical protein n=1 Tax=Citrobacter freundii TaxID=546 RepID=UPI001FF29939|nr:hypothetical protein [Citrobacter freundii]MCJ8533727.1 hypothetical protein [Citrobacter freundii]
MNRTCWGWIITIVYFIVIFIIGTIAELSMPKNWSDWGDFLSGLCSPVAFIWLIIGYYQQQTELKQNTHALRLQAEELKNSVDIAKQQLEHAKVSFTETVKQAETNLNLTRQSIEAPYAPRLIIHVKNDSYTKESAVPMVVVSIIANIVNADAFNVRIISNLEMKEDSYYGILKEGTECKLATSDEISLRRLGSKGSILSLKVTYESVTKQKYDEDFIFRWVDHEFKQVHT